MNKLKIAVDMDEVIVDLIGHWEMIYRIKANIPDIEEIIVDQWDVAESFTRLPKREIYAMLDIPGMFAHCQPIPGAIDGLLYLEEDDRFDVHIVTVAKARTAYSEKIEWVEQHLGSFLKNKTIGLCSFETKAELACNYDVMIEDNHMTLSKIDPKCGCHRILFKQPHNYMAVYPKDFDDAVVGWDDLIRKLLILWENRQQNMS